MSAWQAAGVASDGAPLLRLRGVCMAYAAPVLRDVELTLAAGEVRVLAGENGAGKSTLSRIICGLTTPLAGSMELGGLPYAPASRAAAEAAGVRIVLQELSLIKPLTIAENLFLRRLPRRLGMVDYRALNAAAAARMASLGLALDPATPVGKLGLGQRQMVEIAANLSDDCRLLVLDEPTAMLSAREVDLLFAHITRLRERGVAIIYISHRIDETRRIADSISVLRDGSVVATGPATDLSTPALVKLMTGRELGARIERAAMPAPAAGAPPALRVEGLSRGTAVRDVSFSVRGGEILGIAGLVGAGRTETLRLIYGADRADSGRVFVAGREATADSPAAAVRHGIGMVMEDRKDQGLLLRQPIRVNLTLGDIGKLAWRGWLDRARETAAALEIGRRMSLRAASMEQAAGDLSGGNQQKVAIGRWLHRPCDVLLLDEPTRGIDVGAKYDIYRLLAELAAQGKALVVVSSELNELLLLCDRIAVMSAGRLVRSFERAEATQEAVLAAAFSGYADTPPADPSSLPPLQTTPI